MEFEVYLQIVIDEMFIFSSSRTELFHKTGALKLTGNHIKKIESCTGVTNVFL